MRSNGLPEGARGVETREARPKPAGSGLRLPATEGIGLRSRRPLEAEQAVLGGLMLENSTWDQVADILNEDDFQMDIRALAQDALNLSGTHSGYQVHSARVAAVGPAGIAFKARAMFDMEKSVVLDVMYKFSTTQEDAQALRAAILGAVATAEG